MNTDAIKKLCWHVTCSDKSLHAGIVSLVITGYPVHADFFGPGNRISMERHWRWHRLNSYYYEAIPGVRFSHPVVTARQPVYTHALLQKLSTCRL